MRQKSITQKASIAAAVQGTGNWGRNLVRAFCNTEGVTLAWIVDPNPAALAAAAQIAPHAKTASRIEETGFAFDAAAIATPAADHEDHVAALLSCGKHVLVEKPAAMSKAGAKKIYDAATAQNLCLMVGHQLLFHPVFQKLRQCIDDGLIGRISHIRSIRSGPLDFTKEPGVVWAYGPHDAAMVLNLLGDAPLDTTSTVTRNSRGRPVKADIRLTFSQGISAHIRLEGLPGRKVRELTVRGERGDLIFDDTLPGGALTFTDNTGSSKPIETIYDRDALRLECAHFADCILKGVPPLTGGAHLKTVVDLLERWSK